VISRLLIGHLEISNQKSAISNREGGSGGSANLLSRLQMLGF